MRLRLRMPDPRRGTDVCLGCGREVSDEVAVPVTLRTGLGYTTVRTHVRCQDLAAGNHREQPAKRVAA